jgi:vacuolar-type H+-ATPase subunit H
LYSHLQLALCKKEKNEANEIIRRLKEQTLKEKQDFDQLAAGLQQQMMTAVTMAVQKLDKANEKNAALERENAELKKQSSHQTLAAYQQARLHDSLNLMDHNL